MLVFFNIFYRILLSLYYFKIDIFVIVLFLQDGMTALMLAAGNGHAGIVKDIIGVGADVEEKDNVSFWSDCLASPDLHVIALA